MHTSVTLVAFIIRRMAWFRYNPWNWKFAELLWKSNNDVSHGYMNSHVNCPDANEKRIHKLSLTNPLNYIFVDGFFSSSSSSSTHWKKKKLLVNHERLFCSLLIIHFHQNNELCIHPNSISSAARNSIRQCKWMCKAKNSTQNTGFPYLLGFFLWFWPKTQSISSDF